MSQEVKEKEFKLYTRKEVSEHNNNKDNWFIVHNNIYDVTPFLNEHPGGEEVLIEQAGKDSTEQFEDVGHSADAREMMEIYKIGELVHEERKHIPVKAEPEWFFQNRYENTSKKWWLLPLGVGLFVSMFYNYFYDN